MPFFTAFILVLLTTEVFAAGPEYKPSSRAPVAIDIATDAYGGSPLAPDARRLREVAPSFNLPISGGGDYELGEKGPVTAIVFYRGHW